MPASISNFNLSDGQEIFLPFEASGDALGNGAQVTAVSWQIDDGEIQDAALTPNPPGATLQFDLTIPEGHCPVPDTWYLLTIYIWDSNNDVTALSFTFKRLALVLTFEEEEEEIQLNG